jgi:chorismate mutase/prephenate dehydratase
MSPTPEPMQTVMGQVASIDQDLVRIRGQIDALDKRLVELVNQRARLAAEVGRVKLATGAPVYRPEREAEVLRSVVAYNPGPLPPGALEPIFREVISACRAMERTVTVGILGPPGTFSELAALKQFGSAVQLESCATIDDVFRCAETGRAEYAVVPVENSTEGAVGRSLDLLLTTPLKAVAEIQLPVHQNLLGLAPTADAAVRLFAHPQSLAQCLTWVNQNLPGLERVHAASNAEAARLASLDASAVALGGENAAARYGLQLIARHIQDDPQNRTRFLVLGQQDCAPTGRDKTSLILSVTNRAGAVYHLLAPLARHSVSMTRFESRPARTGAWEYHFFVDVEGHLNDPPLKAAFEELRATCAFFRCLGSYPRAA